MSALLLLGLLQAASVLDQVPGNRLAVYVVTFGPGPAVWERFGHNAILVRDTLTGASLAYDWGRFDFAQRGFLVNFATGDMWYWMGRADGVAVLNAYRQRQRSVYLQELALSPDQRFRLRALMDSTYAVDSGRYRYHYYLDNCSTRVRDAVDAVVDGAIQARLDTALTQATYRFHTRRALERNPAMAALIDAALGAPTDEPVTRYQETFLPRLLRDHLRLVRIRDPAGRDVPLVAAELALSEDEAYPVPETPGPWWIWYAAMGLGLGGVLAWSGRQTGRAGGRIYVGVGTVWLVVSGLAGLALLWFRLGTAHTSTWGNENLLLFNLLALALLGTLPGARRGEPGRVRAVAMLSGLCVLMAFVGAALALLPGGQANLPEALLALPAYAGLWWGRPRRPA